MERLACFPPQADDRLKRCRLNLSERRLLKISLATVALAASYFALARLLLAYSAPPNGAVVAIWFPSGVSVAALLVFGPWVALGAFVGSAANELVSGVPLAGALVVALSNMCTELLCAYLLTGMGQRHFSVTRKCDVLRLAVAALASATISAVLGVKSYAAFHLIPAESYWGNWLVWYWSIVVGILTITPCLVYASRGAAALGRKAAWAECLAALALLAAAAFLWQGPLRPGHADHPQLLVVITMLLWIAFRFPPTVMTVGVFCFAVAGVAGAVLRIAGEHHAEELPAIFILQLLLGGLSLIAYILASLVEDLNRATDGLRLAAKVFDTTTEGIMVTSRDGTILDVNGAFSRITGYPRSHALGKHASFMDSERQPAEWYRAVRSSVEEHGEWQGEVWERHAEGRDIPVWLSISSVRGEDQGATEHVVIFSDITQLREAEGRLMAAARKAGMAEIANNVLHNVGNVLNSVNISAELVSARLRNSKGPGLGRAVQLIEEHQDDLGPFLTGDEKGKLLPTYLRKLADTVESERQGVVEEMGRLSRSVDHIKRVIATQQSYAGSASIVEPARVTDVIDDALATEAESLERQNVAVRREYGEIPTLSLDKARLLLILVNLISNARHAMQRGERRPQRLTLRVALTGREPARQLRVEVEDNGEGIAEQDLERIFAHGYTTRREGHGFGLHSCALAAGEMEGSLTARSGGKGAGATFLLELPAHTPPS